MTIFVDINEVNFVIPYVDNLSVPLFCSQSFCDIINVIDLFKAIDFDLLIFFYDFTVIH